MARMETALKQQLPRWNVQEKPPKEKSPAVYAASVLPLLTPDTQGLLDEMLPLILREAEGHTLEVYGTVASDEMNAQVVVSLKTDLPAEEAFALWDHLGDAVQEWTASLPKSQQDVAFGIAVEVLWNVGHAAC